MHGTKIITQSSEQYRGGSGGMSSGEAAAPLRHGLLACLLHDLHGLLQNILWYLLHDILTGRGPASDKVRVSALVLVLAAASVWPLEKLRQRKPK